MSRSLVLCLLSISLVASKKFNIAIEYTCVEPEQTQANEALPCKKWSQTGSLEEEISCYPGDAVVLTKSGVKNIADLQVGESVLGYNPATGKDEYTPMRAWLHRFPSTAHKYRLLQTTQGALAVSDFHNVAVWEGEQPSYSFAKDVLVHSRLVAQAGQAASVSAVGEKIKMGMFAPLTGFSNFYVGQDGDALFLSHSFAHVANPERYESALHFAMTCSEMIMSEPHEVPASEDNYMHPVAKTLKTVFPFLVEAVPTTQLTVAAAGGNYNNDDSSELVLTIMAMANSALFS